MDHLAKSGVIANLDSLLLKTAPIEPSWIVSGRPVARSGFHSASQDGGASTNVWDCTAGAFRWRFIWDETVLILDGSVKVTSPEGRVTVLKGGDVAHFAARTTWLWEIDGYVRKLAFHHRPPSAPERLMRSAREALGRNATAIKLAIGVVSAAASLVAIYGFE